VRGSSCTVTQPDENKLKKTGAYAKKVGGVGGNEKNDRDGRVFHDRLRGGRHLERNVQNGGAGRKKKRSIRLETFEENRKGLETPILKRTLIQEGIYEEGEGCTYIRAPPYITGGKGP